MLLLVLPSAFLLVDYANHALVKNDAATATEQGGMYAMKQGIVKGSLRDTNVVIDTNGNYTDEYRTQIAVDPDTEDIEKGFTGSMNRGNKGTLINLAEQDESIGLSNHPPMIALRSNTVNQSMGFRAMLKNIAERDVDYVIQNEKIVILEMKETE